MEKHIYEKDIILTPLETQLISIIKKAYDNSQLERKGIFLIGGFVRDKILQNDIRDYDFIVFDTYYYRLTKYLNTNRDNLGLTACLTRTLRAKTCKGDKIFSFMYKGMDVEIKSYKSKLNEDTFKRDFTINAVYFDIFSMKLIDYCGGLTDIRNRLIRTVCSFEKTFEDSFERFIRLARFCIKNLTIDSELISSIKQYFQSQRYKKADINWQSVALQLDRAFIHEKTSQIFHNMIKLNIIECLHNGFSHYTIAEKIYNETINILKKT